jgi:L,D-transpeptidase catalytic domain
MKSVLFLSLIILSQSVFAQFEGAFFEPSAVPSTIESVHMEVYDMARTDLGCSYSVCYRMEIYLNNQLVARWGTSPGDPNNDAGFNGVNTPKMTDRSLNRSRIMGSGYVSGRGDAMPYAMFILGSKGQNTGFAVHAGEVTGQKESHGCVRLEYKNAKTLNAWVRQAIANGGPTTITTHHTAD